MSIIQFHQSGPSTFVKVSEQPSPSNQLDRRTSLGTEGEGLVSTRVSGVNTAFQHETRPQGIVLRILIWYRLLLLGASIADIYSFL